MIQRQIRQKFKTLDCGNSFATLMDKNSRPNFDVVSWPLGKLDEHRHWANLSREALNSKTKLQILEDHGVRYLILLELSYWNILEYHVVDAMHNLLLGLLKWHGQRFWLMSDVADEKEPKGVPAKELHKLLADATRTPALPPRPVRQSASPDQPVQGIPFAEILFGSVTDPSDVDAIFH
ncbi:hypothetical protein VP01_2964g4 [Puccinia sorghi]|uniref:Uncharacterized protein n=1 Tax=Puccinia sorghi TaxID=27349 RepID=A0A0L6V2K2_9BASI|nr:hypothetical protein VP01_2964g4 [Puccinia sorghi]